MPSTWTCPKCGKELPEAFVVHDCVGSPARRPQAVAADIRVPEPGGVSRLLRFLGWTELLLSLVGAVILWRVSDIAGAVIVAGVFWALVVAALCWGLAEALERALSIEGRVRELEIAEAERRKRAA